MIEARNLSENTRVEQTHDGSGQPDERNSSTAHTVKEQHAHEVHREIASFNHGQRVQSCNQRGGHRLQHSRRTAFYRETIAECQRSKIDSEDREPPESTRSSTRPATESLIESLQPRMKRNDS